MTLKSDESRRESRAYWGDLWSAARGNEPHDTWYAIDETKLSYLKPYLPESGRCLEVGCGSARLSRFLARLGFQAVGIDYEPAAIRLATGRSRDDGVEMALLLGDAFALPFATGSFDVVLSTGLLEHFADPSSIVAEMTRVLRPGGVFYSDIVPKKFALMRSFKALRLRRGAWERPFTRQQIAELLEQSGLSVRTVFAAGIFPPMLPLVGRSRLLARIQDKTLTKFGRPARVFDGTKAAELLGLYYFACATKPNSASRRRLAATEGAQKGEAAA